MTLVPYQCLDRPNCGEVFIAHDDQPVQYCPYCAESTGTIEFQATEDAVGVL